MRSILPFNRRSNLRHAGAGTVHLHRVTRDIEADRSGHAVRIPGRPALPVAALDEAVVVILVPGSLASAKTRNVVQDFRVSRRERVDSLHNVRRPGWFERTARQRGQLAGVRGRRSGELDDRRLRRLRGRRRRLRDRRRRLRDRWSRVDNLRFTRLTAHRYCARGDCRRTNPHRETTAHAQDLNTAVDSRAARR